ncbi:hypothetical protein LFT44_10020 [Arthrobacter sp. FW306-05-C]|uniref:hypothetical protein n=1 Tax=unclassified Arthrobacter TaxID=235627 RepID=UPI001EF043E4|nr:MULTISPECIES: hypothetical protein [unclassified Arthrobacter]UKA68687.1 hypothetical protein LFT44_10020 [Arthrobacter sp. FW306-05-C]UKA77321.1 hypothetical protein LFT46_10030 [Arthrobacter sp. FW306-07-I]
MGNDYCTARAQACLFSTIFMRTQLPKSQGILPGLIGYLILEVMAILFAIWTYNSVGLSLMPILGSVIAVLTLIGLMTRIRTVLEVRKADMAIQKTLTSTEGYIPLHGMLPTSALMQCLEYMKASPNYKDAHMNGPAITAIRKADMFTKSAHCTITSDESRNVIHIIFQLVDGGAIWADSGKHEREILMFQSSLRNGETRT